MRLFVLYEFADLHLYCYQVQFGQVCFLYTLIIKIRLAVKAGRRLIKENDLRYRANLTASPV